MIVLALFAVGVALWGFGGWGLRLRWWRLRRKIRSINRSIDR